MSAGSVYAGVSFEEYQSLHEQVHGRKSGWTLDRWMQIKPGFRIKYISDLKAILKKRADDALAIAENKAAIENQTVASYNEYLALRKLCNIPGVEFSFEVWAAMTPVHRGNILHNFREQLSFVEKYGETW